MNKNNILPIVLSAFTILLLATAIFFTFSATGIIVIDQFQNNTQTTQAPDTEPPTEALQVLSPVEFNDAWVLTYGSQKINAQDVTFLTDAALTDIFDCPAYTEIQENGRIWTAGKGSLSLANATTHHISCGTTATGKTLVELTAEKKPAVLYIHLGADVAETADKDGFLLGYQAVINAVQTASPDTAIVCGTLFPSRKSEGFAHAENLQKLNGWLNELVGNRHEAGEKVYLFDSYNLLIDENGYLPESSVNGQALTGSAFSAILEKLTECALR